MTEQVQEVELTEAQQLQIKLREVFDAGQAEGKAEDAIKLDLISAGATFKNVTRMFNEFMVDGGHAASKEERAQLVIASIQGVDLSTESGLSAAVTKLVETLAGASEKSASSLIRALCKKEGIEVFKKAKESSGEGKAGFAAKFYDFLVAQPACTKEQATAFVMGVDGHEETTDNTKKHLSHYLAIHRLVNRIAGVAV